MFYNVDGKTDKPRWFKMPVDIFYDSYGDMKNTDDVQEIIDIYQEDGQDSVQSGQSSLRRNPAEDAAGVPPLRQ